MDGRCIHHLRYSEKCVGNHFRPQKQLCSLLSYSLCFIQYYSSLPLSTFLISDSLIPKCFITSSNETVFFSPFFSKRLLASDKSQLSSSNSVNLAIICPPPISIPHFKICVQPDTYDSIMCSHSLHPFIYPNVSSSRKPSNRLSLTSFT